MADDDDGGWGGNWLSDIRHVVTNPTQTPYVGGAIRMGAEAARTGMSFATGGLSEGLFAAGAALQGDSSFSDIMSEWGKRTPTGMVGSYAGGMAKGLYAGGRLGVTLARHPTQIGRAAQYAYHNPGRAWDIGFEVGRHVVKEQGKDWYEHPERLVGDVALSFATGGAAFYASKLARGAVGTSKVLEGVGLGGRALEEAGDVGRVAERIGEAGRIGEDVADVGRAGRVTADVARAGNAAGDVGRGGRVVEGVRQAVDTYDDFVDKMVRLRVANRPTNLVRRGVHKIAGREGAAPIRGLPGNYGRIGRAQERLALRVKGEGGTIRELAAAHISPNPLKPEFSNKVNPWAAALGEHTWRKGVSTLGGVPDEDKLNRATEIVNDPVAYAMSKMDFGSLLDGHQIAEDLAVSGAPVGAFRSRAGGWEGTTLKGSRAARRRPNREVGTSRTSNFHMAALGGSEMYQARRAG